MKFDVFVSFRGIDTRRTFVSHLLLSFSKKQITTYKDEVEIPWDQSVYSQRLQAIDESKIAIVVISKNYAASSWCLDELVKIIECRKKKWLRVVPVFYEVDPSDVLRQVDDLGDHGDGDDNLEKVKRWRDALAILIYIYRWKYSYWEDEDSYSYIIDEVLIYVTHCLSESETATVGGKDGWTLIPMSRMGSIDTVEDFGGIDTVEDFGGIATTFIYRKSLLGTLKAIFTKGIRFVSAAIRKIAGRFMYREESSGVKPRPLRSFLDVQNDNYVIGNNLSQLVLSNDFNSFVGMDRLMKDVYTLLDLELRDKILDIGISGERGVGKTTLARFVYEHISPQFQDHYYFSDDTKNCSPGACLLKDIATASLTEESESLDEVVKAKLGHRKVLLIVDNMFDSCRIQNIKSIARRFGPGSRLIFITHHKHLLLRCGVECCYVVDSLRYDEALQLFSQFAFKTEQVPREYYQLSVRAVTVTGCIPLALKVFGTFLCGKHISQWEHELCRLETPQNRWDCVAKLSSYFGRALS